MGHRDTHAAYRNVVVAVILAVGLAGAVVAQIEMHPANAESSSVSPPADKVGPATFTPNPLPAGGTHFLSEGLDVVPMTGDPPTGTISVTTAIRSFEAAAGKPAAGSPTGALVELSDGDFGTPEDGDVATFRDRLTWMLTFPDAVPDVRGPSTLRDADRAKIAASVVCVDYGFVDARSGDFVRYFQECHGKGSPRSAGHR